MPSLLFCFALFVSSQSHSAYKITKPRRGAVGDTHFLNICIFSSSFVLLLKAEFWTTGSGELRLYREWHTELPLSHTHTHTKIHKHTQHTQEPHLNNTTGITLHFGVKCKQIYFIKRRVNDSSAIKLIQLLTWADLYDTHSFHLTGFHHLYSALNRDEL